MRVKAEGDPKKSSGYLYYVLIKLGWPKIQVRSIGRAIETHKKAVEWFKNDMEKDGYIVHLEEMTYIVYGKKELLCTIIQLEADEKNPVYIEKQNRRKMKE
mmetsp:Transcript_19239/g.13912  ORF Transcript_19239/g.13912 Transcript_19239/m.13912 type:complete len:101 (-) Transcript_19239:64-366(-)